MPALIAFLVLMLVGVPLAFVLGMTTLVFVLSEGNTSVLMSMPSRMFNGLQNFGLVAIPMFVLLGEIMNYGGITKRLIDFSKTVIGHVRGGLAYVNVVSNMFLASVVGSANAQTAIMGRVMVPAMEKEGYRKDFSSALTAASSIMGPLIPPSMPFIIFGVTAGVSIGNLFIAGIVPGVLFAIAFSITIFIFAKKHDYPKSERSTWRQVAKATFFVIPALSIPVLILVGITTGIFTATESAAVAVFFAIIIGFFVYRELKIKDLGHIFIRTVITASTVTFLVATSNIFGWVLNFQQIPQLIANTFLAISDNVLVFLLLVNLLFLIVGMFIEGVAVIILLTPIIFPVAMEFGVDPVHFGVIMVLNVTLGLMTPPVGTVLFIASATTGVKLESLIRSLVPFLLISLVILLLITYIPSLSLGILQLLSLKG